MKSPAKEGRFDGNLGVLTSAWCKAFWKQKEISCDAVFSFQFTDFCCKSV